MKLKYLFLGLTAVSMLSVGCQDHLDNIVPTGSTLTLEQVRTGALLSSDRSEGGLNALFAHLNRYESVYAIQGDFGYPSFICRLEHAGDNVVSSTHGYNWFNGELQHTDIQRKTTTPVGWAWSATYKNIKLANDVILVNRDSREDPIAKISLGTAKTMRAWDYFLLAQLFGKSYIGNEQSPSVPLVTEDTTPEEANNNPRQTNEVIYKYILDDLNDAVTLLEGHTPTAKNMISEAVAYGIRCRVHLAMGKWSEAAADAQKAISLFSGSPFTIEDCSIPNFDDVAAAKNAMWGIIITSEDDVTKTGIANYTSMFTSLAFGSTAYTTTVNMYKRLNTRVWEQISATDVRRDWWAHEKIAVATLKNGTTIYGYSSPLMPNAYSTQSTIAGAVRNKMTDVNWIAYNMREYPHTVLKFAPTNKNLTEKENSVDVMLMRVEEMYYNLAEAQAMGGDLSTATTTLNDFVKKYRDPSYNKTFNSAADLQSEVYFQKRIEFFGEGISWFDMKRMNKPLDRVDATNKITGGYLPNCRFNYPAGHDTFVWQLPLSEEQRNKAIPESANNPMVTAPKDLF